ncbi:MAG: 16S rRNA (adenine(1518)-N(6)/adenine(1519)-N(6))-dimethyltransferase RsmA [Tepidisphaeraceae bacterium]|jgi:16S rRNA (adenine1518-N6/adenine1519-N6)-dimethyltransferase
MAQTKKEIQSLLSEAQAAPRQRLGQNFMIDGNLVRLVAEAPQIASGDLVLEIGPGTGTLTEELLKTGADLLAVEIDRNLASLLRQRFAAVSNFRLIEGDALAGKHSLNAQLLQAIAQAKSANRTIRLAANLPYNIASPLAVELLLAGVDVLAFTVQREVADRLRATSGKEYGPLSIMTQLLAKVEVLRKMPPQAFWPMPKVDSALVRLTRQDQLGKRAEEFSTFIHRLFSSRRKMLRKALTQAEVDADRVLAATGVPPTIRPEELSPQRCWDLFVACDASCELRG